MYYKRNIKNVRIFALIATSVTIVSGVSFVSGYVVGRSQHNDNSIDAISDEAVIDNYYHNYSWPIGSQDMVKKDENFYSNGVTERTALIQLRENYPGTSNIGYDIASYDGSTNVVAVNDGYVMAVRNDHDYYGDYVIVQHYDHLYSVYSNLGSITVKRRSEVNQLQEDNYWEHLVKMIKHVIVIFILKCVEVCPEETT